MSDASPTRVDLVMAYWCPHCSPISVEYSQKLAERLHVPLRILDIDVRAEEDIADDLVRRFGDWTDDYLIPQVFFERADGKIQHLLTGIRGPVSGTRRAWEQLFASL